MMITNDFHLLPLAYEERRKAMLPVVHHWEGVPIPLFPLTFLASGPSFLEVGSPLVLSLIQDKGYPTPGQDRAPKEDIAPPSPAPRTVHGYPLAGKSKCCYATGVNIFGSSDRWFEEIIKICFSDVWDDGLSGFYHVLFVVSGRSTIEMTNSIVHQKYPPGQPNLND